MEGFRIPPRAELTEIAQLIAQLADSDSAKRESASGELYRIGCALGEAATAAWHSDRELASLLTGPLTVGAAVEPERFEAIRAAFGHPPLADVPPDQDAKEFEVVLGNEVRLDVLTTREPGGAGAIAKFLEKLGEGIQQVEYPTADVDRATEILKTRFALTPIYPTTRPGADGTRVNFFLVRTADGRKVLVELVEAARRA
jgi:hypothetical protein